MFTLLFCALFYAWALTVTCLTIETGISKQSKTKERDVMSSLKNAFFFFASLLKKKAYFIFILPSPFSHLKVRAMNCPAFVLFH